MYGSKSTTGGPIFEGALAKKEAPLFNRKPTIKTATSAAAKRVLTVAKLGDWHGDMYELEYPVQLIDAIRDVIVNVVYRTIMTKSPQMLLPGMVSHFEPSVLRSVADQNLLPSFQAARVAPTSWASRIARCKAIASAKTEVILDAESIACFLHLTEVDWKTGKGAEYLEEVNKQARLTGDDKWDGVIWPYGK
jgi:hypothetical protein